MLLNWHNIVHNQPTDEILLISMGYMESPKTHLQHCACVLLNRMSDKAWLLLYSFYIVTSAVAYLHVMNPKECYHKVFICKNRMQKNTVNTELEGKIE